MIACLPNTISSAKFSPKLMSYIGGEAESLLESLPVEKICKEGGDEQIWAVLDKKYGPQTIDLLQESMKLFFQDLQVKKDESYKQFWVSFELAKRKLAALDIKLPDVVVGYSLLKKLRLDQQSESMILIATGGKVDLDAVVKAIKAVFPREG